MTRYLYRELNELPDGFLAGCLTIGNFDGVHVGHRAIVERVVARAREMGGPPVVFSFDPHPVQLLRPQAAPIPLTTTARKAELLFDLGIEVLVAFPTDRAFLALTADEYFSQIVCRRLRARALVEGPNFSFGKDRRGDVRVLRRLCDEHALALDIVDPIQRGDRFVSSSRVRQALRDGEIAEANAMLTRAYQLRGTVAPGARRGRSIGFPTANLTEVPTLVPALGVYAGIAHCRARAYPAAINVGPNPTFGEQGSKLEVHVLDFDGSIYGEELAVDFLERLRDIQTFSSVSSLQDQLRDDVQATRAIVARAGVARRTQ